MGGTRGIVWGLDVRPCHCLVIWTGGRVACSDCWARDTRCGKDGRTASAQSVIQLCPRRGKQTIRAVPVQGAWGGGKQAGKRLRRLMRGWESKAGNQQVRPGVRSLDFGRQLDQATRSRDCGRWMTDGEGALAQVTRGTRGANTWAPR